MVSRALTWIGPFEGTGAYPTINRQLTAALERAGWQVFRNVHNDGGELTDLVVSHIYPIRPVNVWHRRNVGLAVWEFTGDYGVPRSFLEAFKGFDWIGAPSEWVVNQFQAATETPVKPIQWGFDPDEFTPEGPVADWTIDLNKRYVLWVGGTDPRHGFDVAIQAIEKLPENYVMIAKQSAHYPAVGAEHSRVIIVREDVGSLAPFYRLADVFLQSARGVGFSLPVLEALACGCPVASTDLPPLHDFVPADRVIWAGGQWQPMGVHHVHPDCRPVWLEPDVDALAEAVQQAVKLGRGVDEQWREKWTWDAAAVRLGALLEGRA